MKIHWFQLILGVLFLLLAGISASKGDTQRFLAMLIIANIWIVGSQITNKLNDK